MKFLVLFLALLTGCNTLRPKTMDEFQETSVLIKKKSGGGGSGVIFKSTSKGTVILTNAHVCDGIAEGGIVYDYKAHPIVAFKRSKKHDICYIYIKADLKLDTVLASSPPKVNSKAFASGHPSLYPHIVSQGYVAGSGDYYIHTDDRPCTEKEKKKILLTVF